MGNLKTSVSSHGGETTRTKLKKGLNWLPLLLVNLSKMLNNNKNLRTSASNHGLKSTVTRLSTVLKKPPVSVLLSLVNNKYLSLLSPEMENVRVISQSVKSQKRIKSLYFFLSD